MFRALGRARSHASILSGVLFPFSGIRRKKLVISDVGISHAACLILSEARSTATNSATAVLAASLDGSRDMIATTHHTPSTIITRYSMRLPTSLNAGRALARRLLRSKPIRWAIMQWATVIRRPVAIRTGRPLRRPARSRAIAASVWLACARFCAKFTPWHRSKRRALVKPRRSTSHRRVLRRISYRRFIEHRHHRIDDFLPKMRPSTHIRAARTRKFHFQRLVANEYSGRARCTEGISAAQAAIFDDPLILRRTPPERVADRRPLHPNSKSISPTQDSILASTRKPASQSTIRISEKPTSALGD